MFSISEYNNNLSNISTGGGRGTRNTALKLTTYMLLSIFKLTCSYNITTFRDKIIKFFWFHIQNSTCS